MCADETHVNKSNCKLNDNDEAEAITPYIEHIMLISCIVSTIKRPLYIGKTFPIALFYDSDPFL